MCDVCLNGPSQLADRLQPGDDFSVRITFGPIPKSDLRSVIELLPTEVLMPAVEYPLCHFRRHAIMVPEFGCDVGDSFYGTGMQVVFQTSFPCQYGTATGAAVDLGDHLFSLFRLRVRLRVIEMEFCKLERCQSPDPGPGMAADRQKDEFPVAFHGGQVRESGQLSMKKN